MIVYKPYFDRTWQVMAMDASKARSVAGCVQYNGTIYGPANELFTTEEGARLWIMKEYNLAGVYQVSLAQAQEMTEEDAQAFSDLNALAVKNKETLYNRLARLDATTPGDTVARFIIASQIDDIRRAMQLWREGLLCYHEALRTVKEPVTA